MSIPTALSGGETAIHAAGIAVNRSNPVGEEEIRRAVPAARAAALALKNKSESTGWRVGEFTGLGISAFQNWLYEKNREWHFTDGTLCVLWSVEFPHAHSDYPKRHKYIATTRRDYNNGDHGAPAPAEPCVGYDRWGEPTESLCSRSSRTTRAALSAAPSAPASPEISATAVSVHVPPPAPRAADDVNTSPEVSAARLARLEAYMNEHVLGARGMVCSSYVRCVKSHRGQFFEGQLHHVGKHFDTEVNGAAMRVVVVGQEYGNGPARVSLEDRYHDVAIRTGLQKRFRRDGVSDGRNPHMRGTTSLLRLVFGREPGERHAHEFFDTPQGSVHLYDMFALVNFLLCSAIQTGESETGSKHGRSTPTMHASCARHFTAAIDILEPTLTVVQGKGTLDWVTPVLQDVRPVAETLRWVRIGNHETLMATLSHPSAQGAFNWADLSRPYLRDVVAPTILRARQLLVGA